MFSRNYKFTLNDDYAYTEDKVRVSSLFIQSLRPLFQTHDLEAYCAQNYGRVKECQRTKDGYFVIFDDHKDAAKMLKSNSHCIGSANFIVMPSYSWLQPDVMNKVQAPTSDSNLISDNHNDGATNLIDLNDDCLLVVFKFLNLSDQIQAARACKRLQRAFEEKNLRKFKKMDLFTLHLLKLWQAKDLLQFIGHGVESVSTVSCLLGNSEEIMKFVGKFCVNAKTIVFQRRVPNANTTNLLIRNCTKLREISIDGVNNVDDRFIEQLKYFRNLKILCINQSSYLSGNHLKELVRLKELRLNSCYHEDSHYIMDAIKGMKHLRILEIDISKDLTLFEQITRKAPCLKLLQIKIKAPELHTISYPPRRKKFSIDEACGFHHNSKRHGKLVETHFKNLQALSITGMCILDLQIPQEFSKLKSLQNLILQNVILDSDILYSISEITNLKTLTLTHCPGFTEEKLIEILKGCHKLQRLTLCYMIGISEDIIGSIVAILREQRENGVRSRKLIILEDVFNVDDESKQIKKYTSLELEVISSSRVCSPYSGWCTLFY